MSVTGRQVLYGIAASHGVAVGPAALRDRHGPVWYRRRIPPDRVADEVRRLRDAIEASRTELEGIRAELGTLGQGDFQLLLDAHLLMHRDELLVDAAVRAIESDRIGAEWALRRTVESLMTQLAQAGSGYFRERAQDVELVAQHILRQLAGQEPRPAFETPSVVIASDVSPADAVQLLRAPVLALVTALGSASSHTAILARALDVPAVVGVADVLLRTEEGETVIVDALRGAVVLGADEPEQRDARERGERYARFTSRLRERRDVPATTVDGVGVELRANIELPAEAAVAVDEQAHGIGLYRTEFLYLNRPYSTGRGRATQGLLGRGPRHGAPDRGLPHVRFLGDDKLPGGGQVPRTRNPALGMRGIRLSLARPRLFRTQLRALLRAAVHGPVEVMLPLVTTLEELREARTMVEQCSDELKAQGLPYRRVPLGIMIEVPAAALMADALAREAAFFSVGTNDLVQYSLALDRGNPEVAALACAYDPAVLKLLDMTARAAEANAIPFGMCGDMAADPVSLPLVVGLGYRRLSVPLGVLPLCREVLRRIDAQAATRAAREALMCGSAAAVRRLVVERFGKGLGDLWAENGIEVG